MEHIQYSYPLRHTAASFVLDFNSKLDFIINKKRIRGVPITVKSYFDAAFKYANRYSLAHVNSRYNQKYKTRQALKKAGNKEHIKFFFSGDPDHPTERGYSYIVGAIGEVFVLAWFFKYMGRYDVRAVRDTSQDRYCRGYDLIGYSVFDPSGKEVFLIQIKVRADEEAVFTASELFTLIDEREKRGAKYAILIVPTAIKSLKEEILSYHDGFNKDPRIMVICQEEIQEKLPDFRHPSYGEQSSGFWLYYQEVVRRMVHDGFYNESLVTPV